MFGCRPADVRPERCVCMFVSSDELTDCVVSLLGQSKTITAQCVQVTFRNRTQNKKQSHNVTV